MTTSLLSAVFSHAAKPIAPSGLNISTFTRDSVTLTWSAPSDPDAIINTYRIEKRELTRPRWDNVTAVDASETSCTIHGLKTGVNYFFRVLAENSAGTSKAISLDQPFIPKTAYGELGWCSYVHGQGPKLNICCPGTCILRYNLIKKLPGCID